MGLACVAALRLSPSFIQWRDLRWNPSTIEKARIFESKIGICVYIWCNCLWRFQFHLTALPFGSSQFGSRAVGDARISSTVYSLTAKNFLPAVYIYPLLAATQSRWRMSWWLCPVVKIDLKRSDRCSASFKRAIFQFKIYSPISSRFLTSQVPRFGRRQTRGIPVLRSPESVE